MGAFKPSLHEGTPRLVNVREHRGIPRLVKKGEFQG